MTANENIRINKVLKEFNIGMSTLVEFLHKKGVTVEASPNAKISSDAYSLVEKEFRKEQIVKEESKKVAIKVKDITEKESSRKDEGEAQTKDYFIKTTIDEVKGPKILGKIDLNKGSKPAENTKPVETAKPAVEAKPAAVKPAEAKPAAKPAEKK